VPLLVGGTMLYFKALRDGLDAMPAADPALRQALDAQAAARGWPALHAELARVDPATAARLAPLDSQRIQRALEVWHLSGRTLSQFHQASQQSPDHAPRSDAAAGLPFTLVSLEPQSRAWLHQRIAERFDAMVAAGLLNEVRTLAGLPGMHAALPALRCVGYRQAWAALQASTSGQQGADAAAWRETGIAATRQLAKRQLTWLRGMKDRQVVACDAPDAQQQALVRLRAAAAALAP
jgi:tRNA dimethylallyltransferase